MRLSPFEVTSNTDIGYQATETMAGSRLNTPLKDIAASISVFTEEFIKDINATDLKEVMAYGNNFQPDRDDAGSFGDASAGNSLMNTALGANRTRGLPVDISRNYFKWRISTDTYNVGRVEDARGPNSVLFGIGSAGGIINVATKQAVLKRNTREISLSGGSFGSWRATLDANQPLGDKAAVRINGLINRTRYFQPYRSSDSQRAHLAAKYEVAPWLTVRAEYEKGKVEANQGRVTGVFDSVSRWINAGRPLFDQTAPTAAFADLGARLTTNLVSLRFVSNSNQLIHMGGQIATRGVGGEAVGYPIMDPKLISFSVNSGGPGQIRTNPFSDLAVIATARLGRKTFAEVGVDRQRSFFSTFNPVTSHQLFADPNRTLPGILGANPYAGRLYMDTYWRFTPTHNMAERMRLSVSHEVDAGKWGRYRGGVFGEFENQTNDSFPMNESYRDRPFNSAPSSNLVRRRAYLEEGVWGNYYVPSPGQTGLLNNVTDPISGRTFSSYWSVGNNTSHDPIKSRNYMGMLQGLWFDGRLIVGAGYRKDRENVEDHGQTRDPVTGELEMSPAFENIITQPITRTFSAVWHATKNVSFKYNEAENSNSAVQSTRLFPSTALKPVFAPASSATGKDYGVTVSLLKGMLYASLVRFETEAIGELFSGAASHGNAQDQIRTALLTNRLITQAEFDERETNVNVTSRDKSSRGYELSLTANPGNWRLSFNGSYTDGVFSKIIPEVVAWWAEEKAYFQKFPQNIQTGVGANTIATTIQAEDDNIAEILSGEGIGLVGNAKYKANFFARYSFKQGFLKGAFVGGGYRYSGRMLVGQTLVTKVLQYAPPVGEAALLLGFERRVGDRARLSTQLNVSNLFDETDPQIIRYNNDSALGAFTLVKRIAVRDPRVFTLSTRLSF
ncbi:MAG: hypothetical protein FJ399_02020 [Verrucomicrobia bacterium]|nr:hypothetical protein [Verrucomicrobiota bacterium]